MLYEFKVFKEGGIDKRRKLIARTEVLAINPVNALEKACIRFDCDRIIEIRQIERIERPKVSRIERDGVI